MNRQIVQEMNLEELFDIIRKLLVTNNTFIRCAGNSPDHHSFIALRLIKYLCINDTITELMFSFKLNVFIIMSLERSDKLPQERNSALALLSFLIEVGMK